MKALFNILCLCCFSAVSLFAQKDSTKVKQAEPILQIKPVEYNPLSPSKAAFYSAIFPGAGQIYNNRYWWQLPLIYGGLGYSVYSFINSTNDYDRYRTAYRRRLAGLPDEFTNSDGSTIISDEGLESAQRQLLKNRDLSLLSVIVVYVLQIIEASVTAHLLQFDASDHLSLNPTLITDPKLTQTQQTLGLTFKYSF